MWSQSNFTRMMCIWPTCERTHTHPWTHTRSISLLFSFLFSCFSHFLSHLSFESEPVEAVVLIKQLIPLSIKHTHTHSDTLTTHWVMETRAMESPFSPFSSLSVLLSQLQRYHSASELLSVMLRLHTGRMAEVSPASSSDAKTFSAACCLRL